MSYIDQKKKKRRPSISNKLASYLRNQDQYGESVNLNFNGEETYQTMPGGVISIWVMIILFCYIVLKIKYMIFKEEWQLNQQIILQEQDEINTLKPLIDYKNLSMAL